MASAVYNIAKSGLMNGTIDLDTHTFECLLLKGTPIPAGDIDADTVSAAIASYTECNDASYTANGTSGRVQLGTITVSTDDTNDYGAADAADLTWNSVTGETIGAAIIYKVVGTAGPSGDATHIPVLYLEFTDVTPGGADFVLQFAATGFLHLV